MSHRSLRAAVVHGVACLTVSALFASSAPAGAISRTITITNAVNSANRGDPPQGAVSGAIRGATRGAIVGAIDGGIGVFFGLAKRGTSKRERSEEPDNDKPGRPYF